MRAHRLEGQIVPTQVGSRGPRGQGNVDAIIDQHGDRESGDQRVGQLQNLRRHAIFPAHLHHGRAPGYGLAQDLHGIPPLEQDGIRDHHQAQLIGKRHDQDPARATRSDDRDRKYE